ncbi:dehydrogenase E1 component-domain-containing protein [Zychaea mexicana]|uniref:dehydrogenase E1 component-domain-containing protein n=1 Tax=Zychaea mexicana TaxID=64656 RepID=UPI0022FF1082|nr:dehydrogenase E1 component-domain-containing protein [Zychaea mexicana]KAI9484517.1 dehydrogenase E1 component-domain-containing protein [Zychaea mexicana]
MAVRAALAARTSILSRTTTTSIASASKRALSTSATWRFTGTTPIAAGNGGAEDKPDTSERITITLPEESFTMYKLDEKPDLNVEIGKDKLMTMYTKMTTMRRMEMAADGLYKAKKIRGFCHLCTGQEAVPVGMEAAIKPDDNVITAYRCHGFTYVHGGTIKSILAELMGKYEGISKGKGGSMHMFAKSFYGGNGIVGAQVPLGAGIAFTQKYLGVPAATFVLYGDGAANQGQVFEAFNMAALWDLPCVFVCENNKYGMGTSDERSSASTDYYTRGDYIPGIQVNGMDSLAVYRACQYAKEYTGSGNGPLVIEFVTYRYGGHSMSDPGTTYRTREEIQHMRSTSDPITAMKHVLLKHNVATEDELKAIDKEARKLVDAATKEAESSPDPDQKEFWTDVYLPGSEPDVIRGRVPSESHRYH